MVQMRMLPLQVLLLLLQGAGWALQLRPHTGNRWPRQQ
jgi:hypothetical protein